MDITLIIPSAYATQLDPFHPDGAERAAVAALRLYLDLGVDGVEALADRAKEMNLKPAELIREMLAAPPTANPSATTITPGRAQPKPRKSNAARDQAIADEYLAGGVTYPRLAAKYGLSIIRVTQIVANIRAQRAAAAEAMSGNKA